MHCAALVLSVCNVGVWPSGWIEMKLSMEIGCGPGYIVLDENSTSPVAAPAFLPWGGQWGAADIMEGHCVSHPPFRPYALTE